jgi:hypothetical protein
MLMAPLLPLGIVLLILYNRFYRIEFHRPKPTYLRNMRLIQAIMQFTGDSIEV